jgi:hypothetical protein
MPELIFTGRQPVSYIEPPLGLVEPDERRLIEDEQLAARLVATGRWSVAPSPPRPRVEARHVKTEGAHSPKS